MSPFVAHLIAQIPTSLNPFSDLEHRQPNVSHPCWMDKARRGPARSAIKADCVPLLPQPENIFTTEAIPFEQRPFFKTDGGFLQRLEFVFFLMEIFNRNNLASLWRLWHLYGVFLKQKMNKEVI